MLGVLILGNGLSALFGCTGLREALRGGQRRRAIQSHIVLHRLCLPGLLCRLGGLSLSLVLHISLPPYFMLSEKLLVSLG